VAPSCHDDAPEPTVTSRSGAGRVALVTGGSRGVGQGVAVGLAESGWTVVVSGRDAERLAVTAARLEAMGGRGRAVVCEHTDDDAVRDLVADVLDTHARLDLLVNNVWAGPALLAPEPFWERPLTDWDTLIGVGLRAHLVATHAAVPSMVERGAGLVVNVSSPGARTYLHSTLYGVGKAALDKFTHDLALELRPHGVHVVSLWPGLVATDQLLGSGLTEVAGVSVEDAETPELQGRVVAALAADPDLGRRTGQVVCSAEAAQEYAVAEIDGRVPVSPRLVFGGAGVFPALPPA
jgi:dehydrogenase/reductase SDR family protein 1